MEGIKAKKLSDENLDQVTGGTNKEMLQLQDATGASNLKEMKTALTENGIKAKLSSKNENEYTDIKTGKSLSHEEVLKRL